MKPFIYPFFSIILFSTLNAQETKKDTLFFKYDSSYILNFKEAPYTYYLKDSHNTSSGAFFFKEIQQLDNLNNNKLKCLKKYVRKSEFYNSQKKLHDLEITGLFNKHTVFLVRKKDKKNIYIQVEAEYEIE